MVKLLPKVPEDTNTDMNTSKANRKQLAATLISTRLPSTLGGASWSGERWRPVTLLLLLSHFHFHFNTFTYDKVDTGHLPFSHFHFLTITFHFHTFTSTFTLSLSHFYIHFHFNTFTYNKVETGHLPTPRQGMRAVSIDNQVYVAGGHYIDEDSGQHHFLAEILLWNPSTESWQQSGNLAVARGHFAAVAIPSSIVDSECSAMFLK